MSTEVEGRSDNYDCDVSGVDRDLSGTELRRIVLRESVMNKKFLQVSLFYGKRSEYLLNLLKKGSWITRIQETEESKMLDFMCPVSVCYFSTDGFYGHSGDDSL